MMITFKSFLVASFPMFKINKIEYIDNRMFDMFGREHNSYKYLPNGMYFQNGKKFIKIGK